MIPNLVELETKNIFGEQYFFFS